MTEKLGKFVVVAHDFCHESYNDEVKAVAAAFRAADEGLPARLLHVVQEIDLETWGRCPSCGRVVEKAIGCWEPECIDAQRAEERRRREESHAADH